MVTSCSTSAGEQPGNISFPHREIIAEQFLHTLWRTVLSQNSKSNPFTHSKCAMKRSACATRCAERVYISQSLQNLQSYWKDWDLLGDIINFGFVMSKLWARLYDSPYLSPEKMVSLEQSVPFSRSLSCSSLPSTVQKYLVGWFAGALCNGLLLAHQGWA